MTAHTRGKAQAIRNTNDALSLVQMAEGGLKEITDMITKMRGTAIQAASDTISNSERYMLNLQTREFVQQVDQISGTNMLFGHQLLRGKNKKLDLQIDGGSGKSSRITIGLDDLDQRSTTLGVNQLNLETKQGAQKALEALDKALEKTSSTAARLGSMQKRFESAVDRLEIDVQNFKIANSRLMDTDYAQTTADYVANKVKQSATTGAQVQINDELKQALRLLE